MTKEEALSILKTFKITGDKHHEAFDIAIKALEQESKIDTLDKIRAEIEIVIQEETVMDNCGGEYEHVESKLDPYDVFQIIDKYKAESEEKE